MKERLRSIRYGIGDLGHAIVAPFKRLSVHGRRRLVALIVLVAAIVLIVTVAVPALPCSFPGGDTCAPDDEAIALVPADALVYLHANLDPDTDEYANFADLAGQLPLFSGQIADRALALLAGSGGASIDFDRDVRPWFGGEVAVAILGDATGNPDPVELIEVADSDGADEFASKVATGTTTAKQVGGFLAIGSSSGVGAIEDTVAGGDSLAGDDTATKVLDELPEHRVADAWISTDGMRAVVGSGRSPLSPLTPLLAPGSSEGAAVSLGAGTDGSAFELAVRSALDPKRAKSAPGFFAAFPEFEPKLPEQLPADSLAYLGFADAGETVRALLAQAGSEAPGIADAFTQLADRLRHQAGLDLTGDLVDALGDESALTLDATSSSGSSSSAGQPFPYLSFVSSGVNADKLRQALAALQGPLGDVSTEQQIGGTDARTLQVSQTVAITYAIIDDLAVAATSPDGVAAIASGSGGLDSDARYQAATDGFSDKTSLLGYVDLHDLVGLAEQLGLGEDPVYATFAGEFRSLDALGFEVATADDTLSTNARLEIGGEAPVDDAPSLIPAPPSD
jgi:Protein of unknown function (DUF3352)